MCVRADARDFARVFVCIYSVVYILKLGSVRRFEGKERRNKKGGGKNSSLAVMVSDWGRGRHETGVGELGRIAGASNER